jgi:D-alanyl-D-alanine carboxypeptidase (penicillin-binding protein 5/6)
MSLLLQLLQPVQVYAKEENVDLGITAKAAVLMEASTGTCIYEKDADVTLSPASITKIMTLILIFDALDAGKISLDDSVSTSAHAKSMGGSQVFLEEGEIQTVETMIKCIIVASANDASVAMAEYLAGSEEEFVKQMNERAKGLGMENTVFEDCCGLTDSTTHVTTARDVAIMSRELLTKYPEIKNYSTIWMENITHTTSKGTSEFGLSNTNKLLKMNNSFTVTGLKTGSTSLAKYCLSATGEKDGIELIAVVMAAPDYKVRFSQAQTLLNYGFSCCTIYKDEQMPTLPQMTVKGGVEEEVSLEYSGTFSTISTTGSDFSSIEKKLELEESIVAPIEEGMKVGELRYLLDGEEIGSVEVHTKKAVEKAKYTDYLKKMWKLWAMAM